MDRLYNEALNALPPGPGFSGPVDGFPFPFLLQYISGHLTITFTNCRLIYSCGNL